jgi:hypothetical protein
VDYRPSAFGGRTEHESANPIVYLQRSCKVRFLLFRFNDLHLAYRLAIGRSDFTAQCVSGFFDPLLCSQDKAIGAGLLFKPVEFDGFKIGGWNKTKRDFSLRSK